MSPQSKKTGRSQTRSTNTPSKARRRVTLKKLATQIVTTIERKKNLIEENVTLCFGGLAAIESITLKNAEKGVNASESPRLQSELISITQTPTCRHRVLVEMNDKFVYALTDASLGGESAPYTKIVGKDFSTIESDLAYSFVAKVIREALEPVWQSDAGYPEQLNGSDEALTQLGPISGSWAVAVAIKTAKVDTRVTIRIVDTKNKVNRPHKIQLHETSTTSWKTAPKTLGFYSAKLSLGLLPTGVFGPMLRREHPQTMAAVLSLLEPKSAASVLLDLPECLRPEVLLRCDLLGQISLVGLTALERFCFRCAEQFTQDNLLSDSRQRTLDILACLPSKERDVLEANMIERGVPIKG